MTNREEIREGIATTLRDEVYPNCAFPNKRCNKYKDCPACEAEAIIRYLDSVGVVIKVDRELPHNPYPRQKYGKAQQDMLDANFTKVERLIE